MAIADSRLLAAGLASGLLLGLSMAGQAHAQGARAVEHACGQDPQPECTRALVRLCGARPNMACMNRNKRALDAAQERGFARIRRSR